jgi:hypothetical protein
MTSSLPPIGWTSSDQRRTGKHRANPHRNETPHDADDSDQARESAPKSHGLIGQSTDNSRDSNQAEQGEEEDDGEEQPEAMAEVESSSAEETSTGRKLHEIIAVNVHTLALKRKHQTGPTSMQGEPNEYLVRLLEWMNGPLSKNSDWM